MRNYLFLVVAEPNLVAIAFAANDRGCYRDFKSRMNIWTEKWLRIFFTIPDSLCAGTKIIPDRVSVHTQEW